MNKLDELSKSLLTGRDWLHWCEEQFASAGLYFGHGTTVALEEALALLMFVKDMDPADVDTRIDEPVTLDEARQILEIVERRMATRKPLPYLTGEAWFAGHKFRADERALVPRSPFAELIRNRFQPWLGSGTPSKILDMCTGGGCIAIATALEFEEAKVDAVDISAAALALASENIAAFNLVDRVRIMHSDGFRELGSQCYDLVLCNPPYVDRAVMEALPEEYHHEPALGLAAGDDGLDFVRQFLHDVPRFLAADGLVFVEVGASALATQAVFGHLPLIWVELSQGGEGIFLLTRESLDAKHD